PRHYRARAVRRPGAAGGHRPRHRHGPDAAALRRAHRRPRPQGGRRDPRPAPGAPPRARQDHRHGDPRPARRRTRPAHPLSRQRQLGHGAGGMKYLYLVWKNLWRRKLRTLFTLLAALFTFALFGVLMAINLAFGMGVDVSGANRLVV